MNSMSPMRADFTASNSTAAAGRNSAAEANRWRKEGFPQAAGKAQ
jgi:hypothetical protein